MSRRNHRRTPISSTALPKCKKVSIPNTSANEETEGRRSCSLSTTESASDGHLLFSLADDNDYTNKLSLAELRCRPSKRNRSPYVADVWLEDQKREALAHVPNLDMGGKCRPGAKLLLRQARDYQGNPVKSDAVNPKFGTPKCEFIAQLLYVDESTIDKDLYPSAWVGAHPSLGERIAEVWLKRNLIEGMPKIIKIQKQVSFHNMRSDFVVTHEDGTKRVIEVKTVVDTDYSARAPPPDVKCRFLSDTWPYSRTAIFPWGSSNQKGPDGEKVVSARAIKHVQEVTQVVQKQSLANEGISCATILFVVVRGDAERFRPNIEACPSFSKYLKIARDAGVQIVAKRVTWGLGKDEGKCFDDRILTIDWP